MFVCKYLYKEYLYDFSFVAVFSNFLNEHFNGKRTIIYISFSHSKHSNIKRNKWKS